MLARLMSGALLVASVSTAASAQSHPQTRQGFGISFGLGIGSAEFKADGFDVDRESAGSGYLRIGGHVRPNLFIGGELSGWTKEEDGLEGTVSFATAVAQWYPTVSSGFYLKGGLGFSNTVIEGGGDELTAAGLALSLGVGYDWRVAKNFSLTPYLNILQSAGAEAKFNGVGLDENLSTNVVQIGLGFTWH